MPINIVYQAQPAELTEAEIPSVRGAVEVFPDGVYRVIIGLTCQFRYEEIDGGMLESSTTIYVNCEYQRNILTATTKKRVLLSVELAH